MFAMFTFLVTITLSMFQLTMLYVSQQRGFAFIEFETKEQAEAAIDRLDGHQVLGHHVTVMIAMNNRKSSNEMRQQDKL